MKKQTGVHFYINVSNFNDVVEAEENSGGVNHSIHALDTFFSSIESFGKKEFPNSFNVEKITGSRLHMYVTDDITAAFNVASAIVAYSSRLIVFMNKDIAKYKKLMNFHIQVGASYGDFYEFEFTINKGDISFEEMTTIGFACNYAAKLQGLASQSNIAISDEIYQSLSPDIQKCYAKKCDESIKKYGQDCYYEASINQIQNDIVITKETFDRVRDYANTRNLTDMEFTTVSKELVFERLSLTRGKQLEGIPLFVDVRGFTSQFNEDDSNLEEMSKKTQRVLTSLYETTIEHGGVHVQFQGDREFSLFHNFGEKRCYKNAILGGMRMIDIVKPYTLHVGVGEAFGKMYAVRIGAHGSKDNLLLGRTVNNADYLEDRKAKEDQIAISKEVYIGLKDEDRNLANQFNRMENDIYITTVGYKAYQNQVIYEKQSRETKQNKYNGAWGK